MRPDGAIPGCCKDVDGETPAMVATLLRGHLVHRWTLCNMFISAMGFNILVLPATAGRFQAAGGRRSFSQGKQMAPKKA